jgi:hypothetical protein
MPPQIPYGSAASRAYWRHCVSTGHPSQTAFARGSSLARRDPALGKKIDGFIPRHDPRSCQSHAEVEGSGSVLAALVR